MKRTLSRIARFLLVWTVAWLLQFLLAPPWLVASHAGLSTTLQTLPQVAVALFALFAASLYVLGQQVASTYGPRAIVVLMTDDRVAALVVQALILSALPLFLAAQVPDADKRPSDAQPQQWQQPCSPSRFCWLA
jgi:hypothetical protein